MRHPEVAIDENERLLALAEYQVDPAEGLQSLQPIVDMAARLFNCAGAGVNMVGRNNVTHAASFGICPSRLARETSFCGHAINQDGIMLVPDAAKDERFHDNPLVMAGMLRFYAGIALRSPSGHALGALCLLDPAPRANGAFDAQDRERLLQLAEMVSDRLELRRIAISASEGSGLLLPANRATTPSAILSCDERGFLTACNPEAALMFGWSQEDMIGAPFDHLLTEEHRSITRAGMRRALQGSMPEADTTMLVARRKDGSQFPVELHWSHWQEGDQTAFGIIVRDLSHASTDRATLNRLVHYDNTTGLPDRSLLFRYIDEALGQGEDLSMIITDLSGMSDVNNTLGHALGDQVLRQVGERIRASAPEAALVARKTGNKFAAVLNTRDPIALGHIARAINAALAEPFAIAGQEILIGSYCGMAVAPERLSNSQNTPDREFSCNDAPDREFTSDELVGDAELALHQAYGLGRGHVSLFMPQMRAQAVTRRQFQMELRHAFLNGQFALFYQPQIDMADERVTSAEALIRWHHPVRGLLPPGAFLDALEAGSLAGEVGNWVLDTACAQAAKWRHQQPDFGISVNLSAAQFKQGNLPAVVAGALLRHDLPADALELEITENIILNDQSDILEQLRAIRATGVRLSFDDFGTGFASLNLLSSYPISAIKIDKGFTRLGQASPRDQVVVEGLIAIAAGLGLEVIAEGIEDETTLRFLQQRHCHKGQGYYFGRPCSVDEFARLHLSSPPRQANG
ncbi:PAS domain S-box-containing protein/diguanylate cyclase (GGDEF)-like protein [Novosphingobium sp. SG751A]|uniref:putative bifunctional diguanylate cyclase/phosphodiesterase n=1 Tax=Novosphingobium sp. SG751A TaxID=2587000 RepID=UPI001553F5BF|nr:EAL domain-containing protein [Novosphingobium sp. SG751A]NOW48265.1 PAS domain S-box-containing protein/diguanylate cyclase (GGDEF)-like protein [Novosphingobium sp. SG751A]